MTVYQRQKDIGANLTKKQLSDVGHKISLYFRNASATFGVDTIPTRTKVPAPKTKFMVWDYSDDFIPVMDMCISVILTPAPDPEPASIIEQPKLKRKRIQAAKVKIDG